MKRLWKKYVRLLRGRDKGTVAITFLLSFPIFLLLIGLISQYALLVNAQVTLNNAAAVAGRSAVTALPTDPDVDTIGPPVNPDTGDRLETEPLDGVAFVKASACIQLSAISPRAATDPSDNAETLRAAFAKAMPDAATAFNDNFARRYDYADAATIIHWQPIDDDGNPVGAPDPAPALLCHYAGQRVKFTVSYSYYLSVPGVLRFLGHTDAALDRALGITGSVPGHYITLSVSYNLQLSHGREAITNNQGWPSSLNGTSSP